jgi:hypothetical protein
MVASADDRFPVDINALLASMFELLKERGAAREIALMLEAETRGYHSSTDSNYGSSHLDFGWSLRLTLSLGLYNRMTPDDRADASRVLRDAAIPFFTGLVAKELETNHFDSVELVPRVAANSEWRSQAQAYLDGTGINNQGRVRSDNIAHREVDGLLFRSEPEIHLYRALKAKGVTFAPLPVFLRGGAKYDRLEPDFVIFKDGVVMVVEVDGDTVHRESPADAHERLQPFRSEGAAIERVRAIECGAQDTARECAGRLLQALEKARRLAVR